MQWTVTIHKKAVKGIDEMRDGPKKAMSALVEELKIGGPIQYGWPNYKKMRGSEGIYHCHLNRGRPTYVVCWRKIDNNHLEIFYAGTHENAPY